MRDERIETSDETRREEKIFSTGKRSGDASGIQKCKKKTRKGTGRCDVERTFIQVER